mgnify:CR=1 FL=1
MFLYKLYNGNSQDKLIKKIWKTAYPINGYDPKYVRKDEFGHVIVFDELNNCSRYGWAIETSVKPRKPVQIFMCKELYYPKYNRYSEDRLNNGYGC